MARQKTEDLPVLDALLRPPAPLMLAVERALLRHRESARVTASLAEQIAARLAGLVALDVVHAGQRLLEQEISKVLGVSRAPVREALRILEGDGLVEFESRKGAKVRAPSTSELRDVFRVRAALYGMLLREEMEQRPADLEKVFDAHIPDVAQAARESVDAYAVATFLLNCAVAEQARNRTLADLLQSVSLQTLRYVRLGLSTDAMPPLTEFVKSWHALHAAVGQRDTDLVVQLAERRIARIRDVAVEVVEAAGERAAS